MSKNSLNQETTYQENQETTYDILKAHWVGAEMYHSFTLDAILNNSRVVLYLKTVEAFLQSSL